MNLTGMVAKRLARGQRLAQGKESAGDVREALLAALSGLPPIDAGSLADALERVGTDAVGVANVLRALSTHAPAWLFDLPHGWHRALERSVAALPEPGALAALEPELTEPLRTATAFALWRRGLAPQRPLGSAVLVEIAKAVLTSSEPFRDVGAKAPDRAFERSADWLAALRVAANDLDSIDNATELSPLFEHLDDRALVALIAKCDRDPHDRVLSHVRNRSSAVVDPLVAACLTESQRLWAGSLSPLGRALIDTLERLGRALPPTLHAWAGTHESALALLPDDVREARLLDALEQSQPIPERTLKRFATPRLCQQLAHTVRRNENVNAGPLLRLLAELGPAGLAELVGFFERPVFWVRREEFVSLLPASDALRFAASEPALRRALVTWLHVRPDDDFFTIVEQLELPADEKAELLSRRVWSPRSVALAERLGPSPARARLLSWPDDLRALWAAPALQRLRDFAAVRSHFRGDDRLDSWPSWLSELFHLPEGRLALLFWFDASRFLTKDRVPEGARDAVADVVIRRLEAGVTSDQRHALTSFLFHCTPTPKAAPAVLAAPTLGKANTPYLAALVRQRVPVLLEWVRAQLEAPAPAAQALELASLDPEPFVPQLQTLEAAHGRLSSVASAALARLHAPGAASLIARALELWRDTRSGALGDALLAVSEPIVVEARVRLRAASERGFDRVWHESSDAPVRALAEVVAHQTEPASQLFQRLLRLSQRLPHPATARALVQIIEGGVFDQPRTAQEWTTLVEALVRGGDERSLQRLEHWASGAVTFSSGPIVEVLARRGKAWRDELAQLVQPTAQVAELIDQLAGLPRDDAPEPDGARPARLDWRTNAHALALLEGWPPRAERLLVLADQLRELGDDRAPLLEAWAAGDQPTVQKVLREHATTWAGPLSLIARRNDLGFHPLGVVTHLFADKAVFKQPFFDALECDALTTVTHLALSDRHPKTWSRALVAAAAKHRLRVVVTADPSRLPTDLDQKRVRVVSTFDRKAFFAEAAVLAK